MASRRQFMAAVSGLFIGCLFSSPGRSQQTRADFKHFLGNLELDTLINSTPRKAPAFVLKKTDQSFTLFRKGSFRPICKINRTGKILWELCDGTRSPLELSAIIHKTHRVDPHQAYVDCLLFLGLLKNKGAVLI
ncbi:MAG: PqqD family protein [Deltaproteobacteria bacterium]|nr:PqqD family protein [Deltaproteobacteria bacterium]